MGKNSLYIKPLWLKRNFNQNWNKNKQNALLNNNKEIALLSKHFFMSFPLATKKMHWNLKNMCNPFSSTIEKRSAYSLSRIYTWKMYHEKSKENLDKKEVKFEDQHISNLLIWCVSFLLKYQSIRHIHTVCDCFTKR